MVQFRESLVQKIRIRHWFTQNNTGRFKDFIRVFSKLYCNFLQGPKNPEVFDLPKDEEKKHISDEVLKKAKIIQGEILQLLNKVSSITVNHPIIPVTNFWSCILFNCFNKYSHLFVSQEIARPKEVAKHEVSKRCKDLANFMESLMTEVKKCNLQLEVPHDSDLTVSVSTLFNSYEKLTASSNLKFLNFLNVEIISRRETPLCWEKYPPITIMKTANRRQRRLQVTINSITMKTSKDFSKVNQKLQLLMAVMREVVQWQKIRKLILKEKYLPT